MMLAGCNLAISGQEIGAWMEEAGFINVNVVEMKLPIAPWPKEKRLKDAVSPLLPFLIRRCMGKLVSKNQR